MKKKEITLFEAFAGIGSQYKALKKVSKQKDWTIKIVGLIEWYVNAIIAYVIIHSKEFYSKEEFLFGDVSLSMDSKTLANLSHMNKIKKSIIASYINESKKKYNNLFNIENINSIDLPKNIDIFTYSFPCQDLSSQGLQKGIDKSHKTRSGLLWKIENILKQMKNNSSILDMPKYLLLENVKNLTSPKNIKHYNKWISSLDNMGYDSKSYILNSKDFMLPQNRERVFLISIRKDYKQKTNYKFPIFQLTPPCFKINNWL